MSTPRGAGDYLGGACLKACQPPSTSCSKHQATLSERSLLETLLHEMCRGGPTSLRSCHLLRCVPSSSPLLPSQLPWAYWPTRMRSHTQRVGAGLFAPRKLSPFSPLLCQLPSSRAASSSVLESVAVPLVWPSDSASAAHNANGCEYVLDVWADRETNICRLCRRVDPSFWGGPEGHFHSQTRACSSIYL